MPQTDYSQATEPTDERRPWTPPTLIVIDLADQTDSGTILAPYEGKGVFGGEYYVS